MAGLIFIATFITVFILFIGVIIKIAKHKNITRNVRIIIIIIISYLLLWFIFYFKSIQIAVPFGTNVCFDDWCATIRAADRPKTLGNQRPQGQFIILHIMMMNHARGIAQKPSEPRIHIIDGEGHSWAFSKTGQLAFESLTGKQIPLDERLELHQSLETQLVFDIPREAKNVKAIIEEGPSIAKVLLHGDTEVFILP